jgi:hypothetical protein
MTPDPPASRARAGPRRLLATFDERSVVVWQAHRHEVADEALRRQRFGGELWRTDRVTRFRVSLPSLLARTTWATRQGRERILAVRLARVGFDAILRQAVPAEFDPEVYPTRGAWHLATRYANVTVSWHRDVDPAGCECGWDTPRMGLREHALRSFTDEWVEGVEDVTSWVHANRGVAGCEPPLAGVAPYPVQVR